MTNYQFIVTGKVQKVSYRRFVCANANEAKFSGYVKNLKDKSVKVCVSLEDNDFASFIEILEKGSPSSTVTNITQKIIDTSFKNGFTIEQ